MQALLHNTGRSHFRADGEEPYGYASVIGRLRCSAHWQDELGWYREPSPLCGGVGSFYFFKIRLKELIFLNITKKTVSIILAVMILLLAGCGNRSVPQWAEEETLFHAAKDVVLLMVEEEYETVHTMLRPDQRDQFTADDVKDVVTAQLDGAGYYKQITDHIVTGQVIDGEEYAIVAVYCEFSDEDVLIRISFDADMNLVGFSLKQQ